jgi:tRNA pseudouridine38-40 synthase
MPRYFIEVAYMGTRYSGFQVQLNANTIQAEVQRALKIFFQEEFELTGSSRTDAGVHALQNFFHFDADVDISDSVIYNLNALLPYDIVIKKIFKANQNAHCRFDAISRTYHYHIIRSKDPFSFGRAYYYPYKINTGLLLEMADTIARSKNFTSFSKKKTQVKSFYCNIEYSRWVIDNNNWRYEVKADRFLRGMVKGLTGTMLRIAKNNQTAAALVDIIEKSDPACADFSVSSDGLFLMSVEFKDVYL